MHMEYINSLYYTFSTIAQVLSGFIALGGVFILFKIQDLRKMQLIQAQYFYNYMSGSGLTEGSFHGCPSIAVNLKTLRQAESTAGMLDEINYILNDEQVKKIYQFKSLQSWKTIIEKIEKVKSIIKGLATASIIIGVITIIYSIIILSTSHMISGAAFKIVMIFGISSASLSILLMAYSIVLSLRETRLFKKKSVKDTLRVKETENN
jgi:hypothetical protein